MDAKKLKLIVKGEKKPTFGTDPNEPWSVRAGITESEKGMLHDYLKSRGINPDFVSKDTKISHAKSTEFHKWKRDHMFDDPINYVSTTAADKMKKLRAQTEEVEIEEMKTLKLTPVEMRQKALTRAKRLTSVVKHNGLHKEGFDDHEEIAKELIRRHGMNVTKDHLKAIENERDSRGALDHDAVMAKVRAMGAMTESKKPTALEKFRKASAEREKKHAEIEKQSKEKPDMKGAIDRLEKHLNKEAADAGISKAKETSFHKKLDKLVHSTFGKRKDEMKMKEEMEQVNEITQSDVDKSAEDENAHARKLGWKVKDGYHHRTYDHPKHGHIDMNRYGEWQHRPKAKITGVGTGDLIAHGQSHELNKHLSSLKEETEQINELKKSTVFSWLKKQPVVPEKKPGMSKKAHNQRIKTHSKSWNRALDRLSGYKPTSEDVFQDTQAATQTAFDMGTQADDRVPTYSKRKEMSKSARMIKALYKKNKMVKEEIYDHEKEDKSVATYGKKPKVDKQEVYDDEAQAAMVLKGGKTLTGQTRDTLEIDPIMRKANNNNNNQTDK